MALAPFATDPCLDLCLTGRVDVCRDLVWWIDAIHVVLESVSCWVVAPLDWVVVDEVVGLVQVRVVQGIPNLVSHCLCRHYQVILTR